MMVSERMTKNLVMLGVASTASEAAKKMLSENVGTILVTDKGQLKGLVTDRQIVIKVVGTGKDPSKVNVSDFMIEDPVTCNPDMEICEAAMIMGENKYRRIPAVEAEKLVGILSIADIAEHAKTCNKCMQNILDEVARED